MAGLGDPKETIEIVQINGDSNRTFMMYQTPPITRLAKQHRQEGRRGFAQGASAGRQELAVAVTTFAEKED